MNIEIESRIQLFKLLNNPRALIVHGVSALHESVVLSVCTAIVEKVDNRIQISTFKNSVLEEILVVDHAFRFCCSS